MNKPYMTENPLDLLIQAFDELHPNMPIKINFISKENMADLAATYFDKK